jgi:hypothetical protein
MFFICFLWVQKFVFAEPTVIIDANGNVFEYEDSEISTAHIPEEQMTKPPNNACESMNQSSQNNNICNTSSQSQQKATLQNTSAPAQKQQQNISYVPTVNLDFQQADIHSVIRIFAEVSGRNFILDDSIKGKVTVRLQDVPWDQALAAILLSQGLGWTSMNNPYATSLQQGTIFVIGPMGK